MSSCYLSPFGSSDSADLGCRECSAPLYRCARGTTTNNGQVGEVDRAGVFQPQGTVIIPASNAAVGTNTNPDAVLCYMCNNSSNISTYLRPINDNETGVYKLSDEASWQGRCSSGYTCNGAGEAAWVSLPSSSVGANGRYPTQHVPPACHECSVGDSVNGILNPSTCGFIASNTLPTDGGRTFGSAADCMNSATCLRTYGCGLNTDGRSDCILKGGPTEATVKSYTQCKLDSAQKCGWGFSCTAGKFALAEGTCVPYPCATTANCTAWKGTPYTGTLYDSLDACDLVRQPRFVVLNNNCVRYTGTETGTVYNSMNACMFRDTTFGTEGICPRSFLATKTMKLYDGTGTGSTRNNSKLPAPAVSITDNQVVFHWPVTSATWQYAMNMVLTKTSTTPATTTSPATNTYTVKFIISSRNGPSPNAVVVGESNLATISNVQDGMCPDISTATYPSPTNTLLFLWAAVTNSAEKQMFIEKFTGTGTSNYVGQETRNTNLTGSNRILIMKFNPNET